MFSAPDKDSSLTQGDIIDACPVVGLSAQGSLTDLTKVSVNQWASRVIVLTQACDLVQSKTGFVLVAQIHPAEKIVHQGLLKATTIRDQVRRHQVFGWYFLPAATSPIALPEALVDLRDMHYVPRAVLEALIAQGKRVATLLSPYREHLAQHFAVTYMRVALPEPYATQS